MRLAFLGTGSAFSLERYNGAVVVEGRLLLDGGAPLLPHMHRLGIDPGAIQAVFLTHFHGDHLLGLPPFLLWRAFMGGSRSLVVVGPRAVEERLEHLLELCWGSAWARHRLGAGLSYQEAAAEGEAAGISYESLVMQHEPDLECRGYRLHLDGRILAYAGDTTLSPPLEELVRGADVAVTEATAPQGAEVHTTWEQAQQLAARHPRTRFIFTHLLGGTIPGAASDLEVVDV